eukprot:CAMPEP_0196578284 /NCGR_PEP_ID=MMETSP1081-20130531/7207_1 /TAXON_ID=36882 /ORGANISM="Pyramimonas amylifera, Strain CCMP720" /LENGTH=96 /DNA_ID=CAMNT_0041897447 /DNA_START=212 /DNA_END=499 /DNA_ORIENTATION=-
MIDLDKLMPSIPLGVLFKKFGLNLQAHLLHGGICGLGQPAYNGCIGTGRRRVVDGGVLKRLCQKIQCYYVHDHVHRQQSAMKRVVVKKIMPDDFEW